MNSPKAELRSRLKLIRRNLSAGEVEKHSQQIIRRCINVIPWQDIRSLHTYVPIHSENEADTRGLLEYIWEKYPRIQTAIPDSQTGGQCASVIISAKTTWQTQGIRLPEPRNAQKLPLNHAFDVVIVPVLGFDHRGYRLGYGEGWYDRFLATQPHALTIGIAYEFCHLNEVPIEPHDIALKCIITELQK